MLNLLKIKFILIVVLVLPIYTQAQNHEKIYDHYNDTLLLVNEFFIDTPKVLLKREQVLAIDSLHVNQRGLRVESFVVSASTLGHRVELQSLGAAFTKAMKNEIKNEQMHYKFIYIKDIVLLSDDGRKLSPSIKTIKITFSN